MNKYNEFENDNYLLKTNLLELTDFTALEQAEAFTFSIRAMQIEKGGTRFCQVQFMDAYAADLFSQLSKEPN